MIEDFDVGQFPINGLDFDNYCMSFAEKYGEDSNVFHAVDELYLQVEKVHGGLWIDHLNVLRRALCNRGFEKEVRARDDIFRKKWNEEFSRISPYSGLTMREAILRKKHKADELKKKETDGNG